MLVAYSSCRYTARSSCYCARRLVGSGCGSSGTLRVTKVAVSTQKPGNLALAISTCAAYRGHWPVPGPPERDFQRHTRTASWCTAEEGQARPARRRRRSAPTFALVQRSTSAGRSPSSRAPARARRGGRAHFAQDLNERQEVAVDAALDGNGEVAPFTAFGAREGTVPQPLTASARSGRAAAALNLYGAGLTGDLGAGREARHATAVDREAGDADRCSRTARICRTRSASSS